MQNSGLPASAFSWGTAAWGRGQPGRCRGPSPLLLGLEEESWAAHGGNKMAEREAESPSMTRPCWAGWRLPPFLPPQPSLLPTYSCCRAFLMSFEQTLPCTCTRRSCSCPCLRRQAAAACGHCPWPCGPPSAHRASTSSTKAMLSRPSTSSAPAPWRCSRVAPCLPS